MATFSQRLRQRMDELNIKQVDLVRMTGISKSLISMYLSGQVEAKQQNIYKLAKALGVNEAWLMGYDTGKARQSSAAAPSAEEIVNGDPELTELLERVRDDPNYRMLFSVTRDATAEDVQKAIKIIQALRGE